MSDQPTQSDLEWATAYGKGEGAGTVSPPNHTKAVHKGTVEEAQNRDNAIVDAALSHADSGKPTPDTLLRRR